MQSLAAWARLKDRHKGAAALVLGLGPSLRFLDVWRHAVSFTIGVNDIFATAETDYLALGDSINPADTPFEKGRLETIQQSTPRALFHVYKADPPLACPMVWLRSEGWTDTPDLERLEAGIIPCAHTSVFVAAVAAWHLGATRIGVLGMDVGDEHGTAAHRCEIEGIFRGLGRALARRGVVLAQLSPSSSVRF